MLKKIFLLFPFLVSGILFAQSTDLPFHRGVNLTMWFQESSARAVQFSKYTKTDFEHIKDLGCDVIRLPINMHAMTSGAPDFIVDPLLFDFLDHAVDWAEELGLSLILDNHSFDAVNITTGGIQDTLVPVWKQFAEHYKNRSTLIYYEILNEPHGINETLWNAIQRNVIDTIRTIDSVHTIIVGPANWNSYNSLAGMPAYADTNLIYTFHFYDPFIFTHQGAGWAGPSMEPLAGVPFPYDAAHMPSFPSALAGTWIENEFHNYANTGTAAHVKSLIDIAANFKETRHVRIFCGEFGVYIPNSNNDDRVAWYDLVHRYLEEKGIAWTTWDYQGGFGLFTKGTNELFDYDLNVPLLEALELTVPPQHEFIIVPDSSDAMIYDDYAGPGIVQSTYSTGGNNVVDFYNAETPAGGTYCIRWNGPQQYNNISFNFRPVKDLSYLRSRNYLLQIAMKGSSPLAQFDIRFIDTKTGSADHPWRMGKTISAGNMKWDGKWHLVRFPLSDFTEQGSWDSTWYDPVGAFDWSTVDRFEIASEEADLSGKEIWFDDISITTAPTYVENEPAAPADFQLYQNYPNPFNPSTTIEYSIPTLAMVSLKVYDPVGREVTTLVNGEKPAGTYSVRLNAASFAGGVYFYRITAGAYVKTRKLVLLK